MRILLDTNYWIRMEGNPADFERFRNIVASNGDIEVLFSFGNLVDLVKRPEQDTMSELIAETVDSYIPPMPSEGNKYRITEDPIDMVPDARLQEEIRNLTVSSDEVGTLQMIFRLSDWEPTGEYEVGVDQYRDIAQDYDFKYLKAIAFEDYLEKQDGERLELQVGNVDIIEFVKKIIYAHRISLMAPNENIDPNDIADITICAHGIITECDMLLIERKWDNIDLIERVTDELEREQNIDVYTEFDEFVQRLRA